MLWGAVELQGGLCVYTITRHGTVGCGVMVHSGRMTRAWGELETLHAIISAVSPAIKLNAVGITSVTVERWKPV